MAEGKSAARSKRAKSAKAPSPDAGSKRKTKAAAKALGKAPDKGPDRAPDKAPDRANRLAVEPAPPHGTPPPAPEPAAPSPPKFEASQDGLKAGALSPEQLANLQALSANLTRAALIAQGALAEATLKSAEQPSVVAADPFRVSAALTGVVGRIASQPDKVLKAQADLFNGYLSLWQSTAARLYGQPAEPVVTPERGDKRFADPEWSDNPVFDAIKQAYLLSSNWLNGLVAEVGDIDPTEKRRIEFFTKALTDAYSPSNFLMSNPAALREVMATRGESLVRGMENFAADMQRGGGQLAISQTDLTRFEVGVNVAATPGQVVFQNELFQLIQFDPRTEKVHARPLLIFPPWINKYYILDLRPENSMIKWLSEQGHTVFVVSWVNPDPKLAQKSFGDYVLEGAFEAIAQTLRQTGADKVNVVGYCIAGTMMSCALALMAARGDDHVASTTFFAAQQDFSESGDLKLFTDEDWLRYIEVSMDRAGGVLPGQAMAGTFNALRANDLIWSFFVNNYLMGKDPKPFDLLYWNADQTRMPRALHLFYLREFYQSNRLARGELVIDGEKLDLSKVKVPIFAQAAREDHIAPARSVYRGARLFGGPVTYTLAGSGHIAGVVNAPAAHKYQHWTNPALPATFEEWQADAVEHPGSWWPAWMAWLQDKAGPMVKARDPSKGPLTPLEAAPGSYVKVKS